MASVNAFPFQEQQDYLKNNFGASANVVFATAAFTSGTTTTATAGFGDCRKGTILVTTVTDTTTVYLITAVNATTKVLTGVRIGPNAADG